MALEVITGGHVPTGRAKWSRNDEKFYVHDTSPHMCVGI